MMRIRKYSPWAEPVMFLLFSALLVLVTAAWQPVTCGNDAASIERYIYREMGEELKDHVELLSIGVCGKDRIVIFRRERARPDEVWVTRFRQNENGDYAEYYGYMRPMPEEHEGTYSYFVDALGRDGSPGYFTVWSEDPQLASVSIAFNREPEQSIPITEYPSLTLLECPEHWSHAEYLFYDAQGREL